MRRIIIQNIHIAQKESLLFEFCAKNLAENPKNYNLQIQTK